MVGRLFPQGRHFHSRDGGWGVRVGACALTPGRASAASCARRQGVGWIGRGGAAPAGGGEALRSSFRLQATRRSSRSPCVDRSISDAIASSDTERSASAGVAALALRVVVNFFLNTTETQRPHKVKVSGSYSLGT